jgi:hypothetical protein
VSADLTNSEQYNFAEHLYQISPQSDNKCGKYRFKFVCTPTLSATASTQIFTKLTATQCIVVDICCELQPNKMRTVENGGQKIIDTMAVRAPIVTLLTMAHWHEVVLTCTESDPLR